MIDTSISIHVQQVYSKVLSVLQWHYVVTLYTCRQRWPGRRPGSSRVRGCRAPGGAGQVIIDSCCVYTPLQMMTITFFQVSVLSKFASQDSKNGFNHTRPRKDAYMKRNFSVPRVFWNLKWFIRSEHISPWIHKLLPALRAFAPPTLQLHCAVVAFCVSTLVDPNKRFCHTYTALACALDLVVHFLLQSLYLYSQLLNHARCVLVFIVDLKTHLLQ